MPRLITRLRWWLVPAALSALGLVLLWPARAKSQEPSCCHCPFAQGDFTGMPSPGMSDVPPDTRFLVPAGEAGAPQPTLRVVGGDAVEVRTEDVGGGARALWVMPLAPLQPGTRYVLTSAVRSTEFTTGSSGVGVSQVPFSGIVPARAPQLETCGLELMAGFQVLVADAALIQVDVRLADGTTRRFFRDVFPEQEVYLGHAGADAQGRACLGAADVGGREPGLVDVSVRVVNRAGQLSEPRTLAGLELRRASPPDCLAGASPRPKEGCSSTGGGSLVGMLLLSLLFGSGRRRGVAAR